MNINGLLSIFLKYGKAAYIIANIGYNFSVYSPLWRRILVVFVWKYQYNDIDLKQT